MHALCPVSFPALLYYSGYQYSTLQYTNQASVAIDHLLGPISYKDTEKHLGHPSIVDGCLLKIFSQVFGYFLSS